MIQAKLADNKLGRRTFNGLAFGALATGLVGRQARAAGYPERPITLVVPFAPGGGTDFVARVVGKKASEILGVNIIVENKAGGATVIGTNEVAMAKPDGYTLMLGSNTMTLNPTLRKSLPYDTLRDLAPISPVAKLSYVLVVNPQVKANNVKEFVDYAKANPGQLNFGTAGPGSGNHLAGELLAIRAGIKFTYVPYTAMGARVTALLNNYLQTTITTINSVQAHIDSGALRALGVGDLQRVSELPNVPTIAEAGVPGYSAKEWNGIFTRAGTPPEIINQLNAALKKATDDPGVKKELSTGGTDTDYSSPAEFRKFVADEITKWHEVITTAGITAE